MLLSSANRFTMPNTKKLLLDFGMSEKKKKAA